MKPYKAPERPDDTFSAHQESAGKKKEHNILYGKAKVDSEAIPRPVAGMQTPSGRNAARARAEAARNRAVRQRLEQFKHYPISARRRGIEGAVDVSFRLNERGRAEDMRLVSGSGYDILDEAALETVRRAEPFPVHGGSYRFRLHFTNS